MQQLYRDCLTVLYFSADSIIGEGFGSRAYTCRRIHRQTIRHHGTLYQIQTVTPYPENYNECVDISKLAPDAELLAGLAVRGSSIDGAANDVEAWIRGHGIIE